MGDIQLRGPGSLAAVQRLLMNDASKLQVGQAHYSAMLYPNGTLWTMWCCTNWAKTTS